MSEDRDLAGPQAFAHGFDQLVEIGDELLDRHRGSGDLSVEGFAGPALVPVDDGEALFERRVEVTKQTHLAEARPAMQKDQRRIGEALAADHHPLIDTAEPEIGDLRDAAGNGLAPRPKEGRGLPQTLHAVAPMPLSEEKGVVPNDEQACGVWPGYLRIPCSSASGFDRYARLSDNAHPASREAVRAAPLYRAAVQEPSPRGSRCLESTPACDQAGQRQQPHRLRCGADLEPIE